MPWFVMIASGLTWLNVGYAKNGSTKIMKSKVALYFRKIIVSGCALYRCRFV